MMQENSTSDSRRQLLMTMKKMTKMQGLVVVPAIPLTRLLQLQLQLTPTQTWDVRLRLDDCWLSQVLVLGDRTALWP